MGNKGRVFVSNVGLMPPDNQNIAYNQPSRAYWGLRAGNNMGHYARSPAMFSQDNPQYNKPFDYNQPGYLMLPQLIQAPKAEHEPVPQDRPFSQDWNIIDKAILGLRTLFVTTPQTVAKGLKGDPSFTFSDAMLLSKIPYYIGGAALVSSFWLGGNKREAIRQGAAVLLYLLGIAGTNKAVNFIYKNRWGIDLNRQYRSKLGQIRPMYASIDFARFDLLSSKDYNAMANKMGIPKRVHDREGAVQEQIKHAIGRSRSLKLILGYLLSAVGAGYLARTDAWLSIPDKLATIKPLWKTPTASFAHKLYKTVGTVINAFKSPLVERLDVRHASAWRKATVVGLAGAFGLGMLYSFFWGIKSKKYDDTISPADWMNVSDSPLYRRHPALRASELVEPLSSVAQASSTASTGKVVI